MKRLFITTLSLVVAALILVSCSNSNNKESTTQQENTSSISNTTRKEVDSMLDKLYQIKKGWAIEQVKELLGEPDEIVGEAGLGLTEVYNINDQEKALILYANNRVWVISIKNMETGERTIILE